ncbi:MAG TPA: heterodisulfide reductase-related iron-sulfur binding cluster [Gaiellaceae bacterium]|nr:heterodisulfide reductase-related iron-sulfur binding cluster [Gaiellaceae bacterium]
MRTVAYYKGCLASLSAKELDTSTQALAPKVGLDLIALESVTCSGAGDIHAGGSSRTRRRPGRTRE